MSPSPLPTARPAVADIDRLRNDQGLAAADIDWERLLTISYRRYIKPGGVIIDVGAHNGMHSRRFQRYLTPLHLILVEPIPQLAAGLRREFRRRDNVEVRQLALSKTCGTAMFVLDVGSPGESGLKDRKTNRSQSNNIDRTELIEVRVDRLDDWELPGPVSFMKVDVEGGELDVLSGARNLIDRDRPMVSIEFGLRSAGVYGYGADDLVGFAAEHNLSILDLLGNELSPSEFRDVVGTYYWDFMLVPSEQIDSLATRRTAVRAEALRSIETFNPRLERWKKRLRY